jgi:hypothetical protein
MMLNIATYSPDSIMVALIGEKMASTIVYFVAVAAVLGLCSILTADLVYGQSTSTPNGVDSFTAQKTAVSKAGTLPIHQSHQTVKVLPARDDGKVWVGTISWASSKPVELELWHSYNSSIGADTEHGQPVTAPYSNGTVAFTLLKTNSGTPLPSGSTNFAGDALSFHTLDGSKFTVAYTVDAVAKELNQ